MFLFHLGNRPENILLLNKLSGIFKTDTWPANVLSQETEVIQKLWQLSHECGTTSDVTESSWKWVYWWFHTAISPRTRSQFHYCHRNLRFHLHHLLVHKVEVTQLVPGMCQAQGWHNLFLLNAAIKFQIKRNKELFAVSLKWTNRMGSNWERTHMWTEKRVHSSQRGKTKRGNV